MPTVATTQAATPSPSPTPSPTPSRSASPTPTPTPSPTSTVREFTRAEVAQRNTNSSCWTIVNESVYDLTSWINSHPGGPSAIRSLCGTDGTSAFTGTHGNSGSPMRELSSRYLGKLK
jgi:cytochrome b involved in lipid metabolism